MKMKRASHNGRFGAMAAVARRQFCAKLNVITPQQVQWKPPLRQAAGIIRHVGTARTTLEQFFKIPENRKRIKNRKNA